MDKLRSYFLKEFMESQIADTQMKPIAKHILYLGILYLSILYLSISFSCLQKIEGDYHYVVCR